MTVKKQLQMLLRGAVVVAVLTTCASSASSQFEAPEFVEDLNPGPGSTYQAFDYCPTSHHLLFIARHEQGFFTSLYATRGEPGSTFRLEDSDDENPLRGLGAAYRLVGCSAARDRVILSGSTYDSYEALFGTDGTDAGTIILFTEHFSANTPDLAVHPLTNLMVTRGTSWDGVTGSWVTDASRGGSRLLTPFSGYAFTALAGGVDFFTFPFDDARQQVWTTDGTPEGTHPYSPVIEAENAIINPIPRDDGWLYFFVDSQGYRSQLTLARRDGALVPLGSLPQIFGTPIATSATIGLNSYFVTYENPPRLLVTNGSAASLQTVTTLNLRYQNDSTPLHRGGRFLLFNRYSPALGYEPWSLDSETGELHELGDLCPGTCDSELDVFDVEGTTFLTGAGGRAHLLAADGASVAPLDQGCGAGCPDEIFSAEAWGEDILLSGVSDGVGTLWSFDPDTEELIPLTNFPSYSHFYRPSHSTIFRDAAHFVGDAGDGRGEELWRVRASPQICTPQSSAFCTGGDRFRVRVQWHSFDGSWGEGEAQLLGSESGAFWFFDPANVEIAVKVVDGSGINGHFWVYYGALSNVEYWITVEDAVTGAVREYHNPLGAFGSFGDIFALPAGTESAPVGTNFAPPSSMATRLESFGSPTCFPSSTRTCLLNGRFAVEGTWTDFEGGSGVAFAEPLTTDTGFLWFFDPGVAEILVKLVDGGGFNDHFWVYYGSLSNVEFTLYVTDTVTGETRPYFNPLGSFGSFGDIEAFPAD